MNAICEIMPLYNELLTYPTFAPLIKQKDPGKCSIDDIYISNQNSSDLCLSSPEHAETTTIVMSATAPLFHEISQVSLSHHSILLVLVSGEGSVCAVLEPVPRFLDSFLFYPSAAWLLHCFDPDPQTAKRSASQYAPNQQARTFERRLGMNRNL